MIASLGSSASKAWIAGAVVGSVVGAILIFLSLFLFLRRKKLAMRRNKKKGDQVDSYMIGSKPELHAESVKLPQPVYEMDATKLSELAVHETPQELSVEQDLEDKTAGKMRSVLSGKD